jgi:hypothetical protein
MEKGKSFPLSLWPIRAHDPAGSPLAWPAPPPPAWPSRGLAAQLAPSLASGRLGGPAAFPALPARDARGGYAATAAWWRAPPFSPTPPKTASLSLLYPRARSLSPLRSSSPFSTPPAAQNRRPLRRPHPRAVSPISFLSLAPLLLFPSSLVPTPLAVAMARAPSPRGGLPRHGVARPRRPFGAARSPPAMACPAPARPSPSPRAALLPRLGEARDAPAHPGGFAPVPARARPSLLPVQPHPGSPGALARLGCGALARPRPLPGMVRLRPWRAAPCTRSRLARRGSQLGRREAPTPACPLAAMAPGVAHAMPQRGPPCVRCPRRGSSCPCGVAVAPGAVRAVPAQHGRGALARRDPAACSRRAAWRARGSVPAWLVRGASVRPCAR